MYVTNGSGGGDREVLNLWPPNRKWRAESTHRRLRLAPTPSVLVHVQPERRKDFVKSARSNIPTVLLKTLRRFNANKQAARIISPSEPAAPERREKKEKKKSSKVCGASPADCARRSIIDALEVSFPAGCGHSESARDGGVSNQNTAVLPRRRQVDRWKTHCNTGGRVPPTYRPQEGQRPGVPTRKTTPPAAP